LDNSPLFRACKKAFPHRDFILFTYFGHGGMPHGFVNGVGNLHAANQALRAIGTFLNDLLERAR
jgi:hypothetical protein